MKTGEFLGVLCTAIMVPTGVLSYDSLHILQYSGSNLDVARRTKNGSFILLKENELLAESLKEGKGVYYQGIVYFADRKTEANPHYFAFQRSFQEWKKGLNAWEQFLWDSLAEPKHFCLIKSTLQLFVNGVFNREQCLLKLQTYLQEAKAIALISMIQEKKVAV